MKGFIDEFNERTDGMNAQITELEAQIKEKDKTNEELKEELKKKDEENKKAIEEFKKNLNTTALALAELYETTMANNA